MTALILAAGYGTRLYPLTLNIPKTLLEIGNKYLIDFLIEKVSSLGIEGICVVTNDKFYKDFLQWKKKYSFTINLLNDGTSCVEDRLGAIGDIEFSVDRLSIKDDLLVIGGDNLFDWDLENFYEYCHKINKPVVGLYNVKDSHILKRFGVVEINQQNKIVDFEEKPEHPKSNLAATCIYFFPYDSFVLMREYSSIKKDKDTTGQYIRWLAQKVDVYGYVFEGLWLDIGHKDALERAKEIFT